MCDNWIVEYRRRSGVGQQDPDCLITALGAPSARRHSKLARDLLASICRASQNLAQELLASICHASQHLARSVLLECWHGDCSQPVGTIPVDSYGEIARLSECGTVAAHTRAGHACNFAGPGLCGAVAALIQHIWQNAHVALPRAASVRRLTLSARTGRLSGTESSPATTKQPLRWHSAAFWPVCPRAGAHSRTNSGRPGVPPLL